MKKKNELKIWIAMAVFMALIFISVFVGSASANTIYVPDNYAKIQWAVDNATTGDTIIVRDGIYTDNINVNKQLTIKSENGSTNCIVRAKNYYDDVFEVRADYVNIFGFTVEGATRNFAGVRLYNVYYCKISNNNCSSNWYSIYLDSSDHNNISNNTFYTYAFDIYLAYSNNNSISNNTCFEIYLYSSNGNNIFNCSGHIDLEKSNKNSIFNNNCSSGGIYLRYSNSNSISNNICSNSPIYGISLKYSNNNSISNNNCSSYGIGGIDLYYSNSNSIYDNNCSGNVEGIHLSWSMNNKLKGNVMINNGVAINGDSVNHFKHEIDTSNTVNEKPVYYWKDVQGGRIPDGAGQIILVNCKAVVVENQNLNNATVGIEVAFSSCITIKNNNCSSNNWYGIFLVYSNKSSISNNNCSNGRYGIRLSRSNNNSILSNNCHLNKRDGINLDEANSNSILNNNCSNNNDGIALDSPYGKESNNNRISNNICSNNEDCGIYIDESNKNSISNNICSNNEYGIHLDESNNNDIYLNNFVDNIYNAYSYKSTNTWNSKEKITYAYREQTYTGYMGNYWDDYRGSDADRNGIGDTPYSIDSDKDYYPLAKPFENYEEKWSFAIITDIHLGYGLPDYGGIGIGIEDQKVEGQDYYLTKRLEKVVDRIIDLKDDYNIKFVAVLGDISDTAEKSELLKAKQILDKLNDASIPYVPLIGNHDVWPYTQNASWIPDDRKNSVEEKAGYASGEIFFEDVFWNKSINRNLDLIGELFGDSWKRQEELPGYAGYPYLQNYAFRHGEIQFICLDYNWKVPPGDLKGGLAYPHKETLKWLTEYSAEAHFRNVEVITFLHYPLTGLGKGLSFGGHVHSRWADDNTKWTWLSNMIVTEALLEESEKVIRIVQVNGKNINYETLEGIPKTEDVSEDASEYLFFVCPSWITKPLDLTPFKAYGKKLYGEDIVTYEWNFGDGSSDSGKEVNHMYLFPGKYTVNLTVRNVKGEEKTISGDISVIIPKKILLPSTLPLSLISLTTGEDVSETPQNTLQSVLLTKSSSEAKPIAKFIVHFENATEGIDLSNLTADVNLTARKSVIYMPSWPNEIEESKILYIPSTGKGAVYICKNATSLEEITPENAEVVINVGETKDGLTVVTTLYNDTEYYVVFNVTGTGGGEFTPIENIFDTDEPANPYPSIMGIHNGTIKPNQTIEVQKLYTYPCLGTGGHTEYAMIWNETIGDCVVAEWNGYIGDYHNISFNKTLTLGEGMIYNYTIHTGSYPQIIHESPFIATGGEITCTKFTDANGKVYYDWIPAIRLWA